MKTKDFGVIIVRASAVWMLFQAALLLESIPIVFLNPLNASDAYTRFAAIANVTTLMLYAFTGLFLLRKTHPFVDFLVRGTDEAPAVQMNPHELAILSFGVAGLFIFVDGLQAVVIQSVTAYAKPEIPFGAAVVKTPFNLPVFVGGIAKALVGCLLVFSPRGVMNAVKWTRRAGTQQ